VVIKAADLLVVAGNQHRDVLDVLVTYNGGDVVDTDDAKGSCIIRTAFVPRVV
jgi:hypothetical protein